MREWLGIQEWLRGRLEPRVDNLPDADLPVQSTGRNETFRHGPDCEKPRRPCGCMPTYRDYVNGGPTREFWRTPHPNRAMRRRAEKKAKDATS